MSLARLARTWEAGGEGAVLGTFPSFTEQTRTQRGLEERARAALPTNWLSSTLAEGHWASMAPWVLFNRKWGWNLWTALCCWSKIKVVLKDVELFQDWNIENLRR